MTKILIDEAVVRQAMEDFVVIKYGLEKSRIWGGVDWTYNPIHPVHYLPLRDKAEARMESLNQALADAALDKMAENARELGLSYEQPAPAQCWKCGDMDAQFQAKCTVPYCAMKEQAAPAQEPVAWMHEWADGEKIPLLTPKDARVNDQPISVRPLVYGDTTPQAPAQNWVGLTDEEISEIHDAAFGKNIGVATGLVEKKLKEKNTKVGA